MFKTTLTHKCVREQSWPLSNARPSSQGPCRTVSGCGKWPPTPLSEQSGYRKAGSPLLPGGPKPSGLWKASRRREASSNCSTVSSGSWGKGKHLSNKQRREKINKDVCNEFLFPEIAQQEPCQEESGLISDKMRDTNPRAVFRSAAPRGSRMSATGLVGSRAVGEQSGEGTGGRDSGSPAC